MLPHWTKAQLIRRSPLCQLVQMIHFKRTGTRLTHRLHTMMMTTTAMRKTKPAAAEPMMSGSFSWILVLYSSIKKKKHIHKQKAMCTHTQSHKLKHMDEHLSHCIWREQWVTDRHTAGWTNEHLGILTGCNGPFSKAHWMCSDAVDTDKSSGRKRVKWAERACLGETQTDQAAKSRNPATEWAHRGRARHFSWALRMTQFKPDARVGGFPSMSHTSR